jgi:D-inositol-3-phosphate glycosyltransferase
MRTLYFHYLPSDFEDLKSLEPDRTTLFGANVYGSEVFQALLRHSSYDRILLPETPRPPYGDLRDSALFAANSHRIQTVAEHEMAALHREHVILVTPSINIDELVHIRSVMEHTATPIMGVIHSLNYTSQLKWVLRLVFSALEPFDVLSCSSVAGQHALRKMIQLVEDAVALSEPSASLLRIKTPIIPLGLETERFRCRDRENARRRLSIGENQCVVLYFGRFSPTSKADLLPLITAFGELVRDSQEVILALAGDDTEWYVTEAIRGLAQELGCASRLMLIPNPSRAVKDQLYIASDVFVSPVDSLQETFGITIIEAMSAGLPVVASDWDGYRDTVIHEQTGFLIPTLLPGYPDRFDEIRGTGNMRTADLLAATTTVSIPALISALRALVVNPDLRRQFGRAGERRAREVYDWAVIIKQYEELWQHLKEEAQHAGKDRPTVGRSLNSYSYRGVFGHYATKNEDAQMEVFISDIGRQWIRRPDLLSHISNPKSLFSPEYFRRALTVALDGGASTVADLASCIRSHEDHTDTIRELAHVWRLLKYGLLETADLRTDLHK